MKDPEFSSGAARNSPARQTGPTEILDLFRDWTEDEDGLGRLLITCRPEETGLAGTRHYELSGLSRPDSLHLLDRVIRKAGAAPDRPVDRAGLGRLAAVVSDHPLSLELIGPHLVRQSADEIIPRITELLSQFATDQADVARNSSLLASLRFSTDRLSDAARAALPWLGMFQGGVFEQLLLDVSQIAPESWQSIRGELEATALIRVEDDLLLSNRPYLRFHPTLSFAVGVPPSGGAAFSASHGPGHVTTEELAEAEAPSLRQRFVGVYYRLGAALSKVLEGKAARARWRCSPGRSRTSGGRSSGPSPTVSSPWPNRWVTRSASTLNAATGSASGTPGSSGWPRPPPRPPGASRLPARSWTPHGRCWSRGMPMKRLDV